MFNKGLKESHKESFKTCKKIKGETKLYDDNLYLGVADDVKFIRLKSREKL